MVHLPSRDNEASWSIPRSTYRTSPDVSSGVLAIPDNHQDTMPYILGSFVHMPKGITHTLLHFELGYPKNLDGG
jgi:hypothetical protein